MQVIKTSSLFFCLIFLYFFNANSFQLHSQAPNDSLNYYYDLSKADDKSNDDKIKAINRLVDLAYQNKKVDFILNGLNRKSYLYSTVGDYNNAIATAKTLLEESNKEKDTSKILLAYRRLADYNRRNDSLLNAYEYYQKHKDLNISLKDSLGVIRDLRFITSIQFKLGLLHESESSAVEALRILDKLQVNNKTREARIGLSNHLGIIYNQLGDYNGALKLYNKLLKITTDIHHLNIIHNNKANVYREQKRYELAATEFDSVYKNSLKIDDEQQMARALNNLAFVRSKFNAPGALEDMMSALELRKKNNVNQDLFSSYRSLAEYYKDRGLTNKMIQFAKKAYEVTQITNNHLDRITALSYLIETGDIKNIIEYKKLSDSITRAKQNNENKFSYIKYNYLKKEQETRAIELKFKEGQLITEKEKLNKTIYQSIAIIGLLLTIFLYFIIKSKHKKEKLLQVYNTETRISKKVHDEVANDIYHAMTKLQIHTASKDDVLDDLEMVYNKTRDISNENSIIDMQGDFQTLIKDLLQSYKTDAIKVIVKDISKIKWDSLTNEKKMMLYRVLQELMTNMRKHSKASFVVLTFAQVGKKISINYKDNGIGCKLVKNNGLRNTENRIESIKGTITFETQVNRGFKAILTV